ncbi:nucleotide disphospho-sugar-binding domain-containing protein [Teredinibacter purpureus]|uniref:nucleotide disphospho-sugar-binding domain-containing protein n=1 Tax=Teredinibacter purpureus TaxID=2731756 RepID=UPI0005F83556|nr:nucleotide disphospho-sugar-binding domain-containing protein [Teredinibacter purpureus]
MNESMVAAGKNERVIISSTGTLGDIYPFIGLGVELKALGYEIDFITNDSFKTAVEDEELNFISNGPAEEYQRTRSELFSEDKRHDCDLYYQIPAMERTYKYLIDTYDRGSKLLIITTDEANGASAASEEMGWPIVKVNIIPQAIFSIENPPAPYCWEFKRFPAPVRRLFRAVKYRHGSYQHGARKDIIINYINGIRKANGMPKFVPGRPMTNKVLELGLFPEWYSFRSKDWSKDIKLVGFPCWVPSTDIDDGVVDDFIRKNGKPILFTVGTGVSKAEFLIDIAKDICEELEMPCLFVGGRAKREIEEDRGFLYLPYVNFDRLMPKCLALVHHGGIGTLSQAIKSRIPQLIIPFQADQPDNALRVKKLGVGDFVFPHCVVEPDIVIPMIRELVKEAEKNNNLAAFSAEIGRSQPLQKAGSIIDGYLREQNGVVTA